MNRKVIRATQSPLNAYRWCLDLDCGHHLWVTRKRKPTTKETVCEQCSEKLLTKLGFGKERVQ